MRATGVRPQGQASTDGNLDSTVVELSLSGKVTALSLSGPNLQPQGLLFVP